jgi:diadenosine tetraphosphate (Ap4A) HIT family hydrolase
MLNQEQAEQIRSTLLKQIDGFPAEQANQAKELREQILNATPEELEKFVKQGSNSSPEACIFCKLASGEIKTFKVYESPNILAFMDINPVSKGHLQVIPKRHFQFIFQITDDVLFELFMIIKKISPLLINLTGAKGLTTIFHQGKEQTVQHFSVSLIPRFNEDELNFEQQRQKANDKELSEISQQLFSKISKDIEESKQKVQKEEQHVKQKEENEKKEISFFKRRIPR